jgi:hypothetical protein
LLLGGGTSIRPFGFAWNTGSSIVSESSARLAEICQALFGAAVDCRYMVRGKERYLRQDVPNLKELSL